MSPDTDRPPLIVSSRDFARLEQLLDAPARRNDPAALALMEELDRATVVDPEAIPADVVTMNSTVTCIDEASGAEHVVTLCYPHQANAAEGRISILAPLGSALLGLSVGQSIDWERPGSRPIQVRVAALSYQPEASGDIER